MATQEVIELRKHFGKVKAVDGVNFHVENGEFLWSARWRSHLSPPVVRRERELSMRKMLRGLALMASRRESAPISATASAMRPAAILWAAW